VSGFRSRAADPRVFRDRFGGEHTEPIDRGAAANDFRQPRRTTSHTKIVRQKVRKRLTRSPAPARVTRRKEEMSDSSFWTKFVLAALATWRITHAFSKEDGPADVMVRVRIALGNGLAGSLMDCFYCASVWVAAPMAWFVARDRLEFALTWLALSAAACLLDRPPHAEG
jgi:uncharacterized protein DUF1360